MSNFVQIQGCRNVASGRTEHDNAKNRFFHNFSRRTQKKQWFKKWQKTNVWRNFSLDAICNFNLYEPIPLNTDSHYLQMPTKNQDEQLPFAKCRRKPYLFPYAGHEAPVRLHMNNQTQTSIQRHCFFSAICGGILTSLSKLRSLMRGVEV